MNINHFEKNFHYTDKEMLHVARKLGKLATFCKRLKDDASVIKIEAEKRSTKKASDEMKAVIIIELPGKVLKADSRKSTITEAVDRACDKLEPQLKKYKDMHSKRSR